MRRGRALFFVAAVTGGSLAVVAAPTPVSAGSALPTQCIVPVAPLTTEVAQDVKLPSCADIEGLCLNYTGLNGPSRTVHGRVVPRVGGAQIGDCGSFLEQCVIDIHPSGPSRPVHAVPRGFIVGDTFNIPAECVLPVTGSGLTIPALYAGLGAVAVGLALVSVRRRRAV